jgi:molybdenum cofactor guanylyltransferase
MINDGNSLLHGLVLAGGRSQRMGRDKACLMHPDGRSLARRGHEMLVEAGCGTTYLSLRHDQEIPDGFGSEQVLRDPPAGSCGPLTGILTAMRLHPRADWLVVACDLPRLDMETLATLISGRREGEMFLAFRSSSDGLPEPLCAIYASASRAVLEEAAAAGFHCPRKILIRNHCRLLEAPDARSLDNANTPADWEKATARDE